MQDLCTTGGLPGETELALAVRECRVAEVARLLTSGADPNEEDPLGETPLFDAATAGHPVITALLLSQHADPLHRSHAGLVAADFANGDDVAALIAAMSPPRARRYPVDENVGMLEAALRQLPAGLRKRFRERLAAVALSQALAVRKRLCARGRPGQGVCSFGRKVDRAKVLRNAKLAKGPVGVHSFSPPAAPAPTVSAPDLAAGEAAYRGSAADEGPAEFMLPYGYGLDTSEGLQFCDLLFREITPDDYDLLLQLDEAISRPTVGLASVQELPEANVEEAVGQQCAVCCTVFGEEDDADEEVVDLDEQSVRRLPCSHLFHFRCISKWLCERSRACPVCNCEVCQA